MLKRKYKEDMDISKIPTFQSFSTEIMNEDNKIFHVDFTIDGHITITHENPIWIYHWYPSIGQYVVDDNDMIVNPWTIKKEFHGSTTKYMFLYNGTDRCEIYVDQTKHIATVFYMDSASENIASKSFSIYVKEEKE